MEATDLHFELASYALGLLAPEKLPELATEALVAGHDSPSLAVLAGESPRVNAPADLRELFERALRELGLSVPQPLDAARVLIRHYAGQVAAGALAPRRGAALIVHAYRRVEHLLPGEQYAVGESLGINPLVAAHYEYDDLPCTDASVEPQINADVIAECTRITKAKAA